MKNTIILLVLSFFLITGILTEPLQADHPVSITILYDNYTADTSVTSDWGFSCIIEGTEKTILFDTGTKSDILLQNSEKLKINLNAIDLIVITHNHQDHTGGLDAIMEKNPGVSVYLPISFPESFSQNITSSKATPIRVDKPTEICENVHSTGEMGDRIKEQSLILDTKDGLVIVTGCSHQGIVSILQQAKEMFDKEIYLVFGGFHLLRHSDDQIEKIIREFKNLGVKLCGATHCTGEEAIKSFKNAFGENYVPMGVGKVIQLSL